MPDTPEPTTALGLPAWGFALTDPPPVVCQWFHLVERLEVPT
ncbi:MAG: hypothetical protein ACRDIL_08675 [Candidatus Limnocylindrales bacterium]